MEAECILKLSQCREELLDSLEFDMISPGLIQHGVITSSEYEKFRDLSCNKDKVESFLDFLPKKNFDTFSKFVKSLEEDYDWLAFSLKNAQVSAQDVETFKQTQNNNNKPGPSGSLGSCGSVVNMSGVVNNCETMSVSQSSNSSGISQDDRERREEQGRNDRMAIERDREQRHERDRERWDHERRFRDFDDRRGRLDDGRSRIENDYDRRSRLDLEERRMEMFERDYGRYDRSYGYIRRDIIDHDRAYGHDRLGRGYGQELPRHDMFAQRPRQEMPPRTLSQESLDRLGGGGPGLIRMGSPIHSVRGGFGHSPMHSSSGGFGSPLHSSEFSLKSSESGDERLESMSQVGEKRRRQDLDTEITEEMIDFVMMNPRIMKRWHTLAHAAGLSGRVEVIKARIRQEGRDMDEHVAEFLREWIEQKPEAATLGGLISLLRDQKFNDTALKLEEGTFKKRRT